jgi:predicted transcriptional regulator
MPLKDLLINEEDVSEELVEEILSGSARLAGDTRRVLFTPEGSRLSARAKVILVLAAQHAWRFVSPSGEGHVALSIREIQDQTGIHGNTLRPTLKGLKDGRLIEASSPGAYYLPAHSLQKALEEINKGRGQKS